ncbi:MAG: SDR family oxidoreductase [Chloroflexota bacterium]|nr:MAG: SDR family oxidoreductase [Chloroflexota bacterium]
MIDPRLNGRVAVVTGANHGIGAATARALAAQGAAVFLTYLRLPISPKDLGADLNVPGRPLYHHRQAQSADAVVAALRAADGRADSWEADLADPATVPALFDRAEAAFGAVEILVNNATHCVLTTLRPEGSVHPTITADEHDRHFAVNSRAPAMLMAEFARRHVARGANWGRIVNVSTDAAHAHPDNVAYSASKHALESWSRSAAAELGRYGITVNVVAPGPIQTGWLPLETASDIALATPLGRVGEPEDVADVIVFLASEPARWLTGQLLYVGGGYWMSQ